MTGRRRSGRITPKLAALLDMLPLPALLTAAEALTLDGHGHVVTYSPAIDIRLTGTGREACGCCPASKAACDDMLDRARRGAALGCREAYITLERPANRATLDRLAEAAEAILGETQLLPHLDPGPLIAADYTRLRPFSASMRVVLESASERLCEPGGPLHDFADMGPARGLGAIRAAARARVPLTVSLTIGKGENRAERIETLAAIRDIQRRRGHIQEMAIHPARPEMPAEELLWTIAATRLIFGPAMTIQTPPDFQPPEMLQLLLRAGVNDWGGIRPDIIEAPHPGPAWSQRNFVERETRAAGRKLAERLAIAPAHALDADRWAHPAMARRISRAVDARGLPKRRRAHLIAVK